MLFLCVPVRRPAPSSSRSTQTDRQTDTHTHTHTHNPPHSCRLRAPCRQHRERTSTSVGSSPRTTRTRTSTTTAAVRGCTCGCTVSPDTSLVHLSRIRFDLLHTVDISVTPLSCSAYVHQLQPYTHVHTIHRHHHILTANSQRILGHKMHHECLALRSKLARPSGGLLGATDAPPHARTDAPSHEASDVCPDHEPLKAPPNWAGTPTPSRGH